MIILWIALAVVSADVTAFLLWLLIVRLSPRWHWPDDDL